jgi:hypothetical protein
MVLGDTHGDIQWCVEITRLAGAHGVQRILQVGDFGYWPRMMATAHASHAQLFLDQLDDACEDTGVRWDVLDGNHDDHLALRLHLENLQPDDDGMIPLSRHVRYTPRGNSFTLAGVAFGSLGGAASIDALLEQAGVDFGRRPYREGWDWFPELECPTLADVARLPAHVDVLLTHEAPLGIDLRHFNGFPNLLIPPEVQTVSDLPRCIVAEAIAATTPSLVIHGHWHGRNQGRLDWASCDVLGLAANSRRHGRDARSFAILDLPDLTIKTIKTSL